MEFANLIHKYLSDLNPTITVDAAYLRFLTETALPAIHYTLDVIYDLKNKTYVHPTCSNAIRSVLNTETIELDPFEQLMLKEFMRQDYHDPKFVEEFVKIIDTKFAVRNDEAKRQMNKIFAVDGLYDYTFLNNIHNLQYSMDGRFQDDFSAVHSNAVRTLYDQGLTPQEIFTIMVDVHNGQYDHSRVQLYLNYVGNSVEEIKQYIIDNIMNEKNRKMNTDPEFNPSTQPTHSPTTE